MEFRIKYLAVFLFLGLTGTSKATVFDVTKYGAKPEGDIAKALLDAFKEACASTVPAKIVVPAGNYNANVMEFKGPCKAPIELQMDGIIKAPADPSQVDSRTWINFIYLDQFTLSGKGTFDGQGAIAWSKNDCNKNTKCAQHAMNLAFNFLTNSTVKDVTTKDSKNFQVNVLGCKNLTFSHFNIQAPAESLNTDGIHIGKSEGIYVLDSNLGTGDDCVSIGDGSKNITVERTVCGPGHGISIGSLGKYEKEEPVVGVTVKNCTFLSTDNGVRIKTWPKSFPGSVSEVRFEDIIMKNVSNPIVIDQVYCPWNQCTASIPSKVKLSNIFIKNIRGTSFTSECVKISCSKEFPCENVELADIDLKYDGPRGPAASLCANVKPKISGVQFPPACTHAI